ncbi:MAG: hypothetical protein AAGD14_03225 [Planctomycetota bacterium]
MNGRRGFDSLFLLVVTILLGHGLLFAGRMGLLGLIGSAYGEIGLDEELRVRQWQTDRSTGETVFLAADEVSPGERITDGSWSADGEWDLACRFLVRVPTYRPGNPVSIFDRFDRGKRRIDIRDRFPERAWRSEGMSMKTVEHGRLISIIHDERGSVFVQTNGTGIATYRIEEGEPAFEHRELDPPLDGLGYHRRLDAGDAFVGIVGNEYWILGRDGEFVQRQLLGTSYKWVTDVAPTGKQIGLLAWVDPARPDRLPVRMILARPGEEIVERNVVLEPVTLEQRVLVAGCGLLTAFRPLPLNIAAAAGKVHAGPRAGWLDPWFDGGANREWLLLSMLASLLCAWRAASWARLRAPRHWIAWTTAVFLLGPMGLVWMRLALPWYAIENGRPVNLGDWPDPAPTGREVFA